MEETKKDIRKTPRTLYGTAALTAASVLWGSEFVVAKDVLSVISPNWTNVIRFFLTSVFALVIWNKNFRNASAGDLLKGAAGGLLMGLGYAFQTMGLATVNAGVNAFLSAAYVIIIPFIVWIIEKHRPGRRIFTGMFIAMAGVTMMSVSETGGGRLIIGQGEIFSLIGAVFYAGAIVSVDYFTSDTDISLLTGMQFIFTFIVAAVMAFLTEPVPSVISAKIVYEFIYLIVFGTFFTQWLFNAGMKYVSSERGSVIFLLESVSAAFFGRIFLGEQLRLPQIAGSVLIISAILVNNIRIKRN